MKPINAYSKEPGDDSQPYPQGTAGYNGKTVKYNRLLPYGLCAVEPAGSFILLLNEDAIKYGIPAAMEKRLSEMLPGEAALFNVLTKTFVYLKADGSIEISGAPVRIKTGDLEVDKDVIIKTIGFLNHYHAVTGGNTDVPLPGPPPP